MHVISALFTLWSFLCAATFALPIVRNLNEVALEKRSTHNGQATYYYADGTGACGSTLSDNDPIVAISQEIFRNDNCGQWVEVRANGKTVHGQVLDSCGGGNCHTGYNLDLSSSLFKEITSLDTGVIQVDWSFKPKGWSP